MEYYSQDYIRQDEFVANKLNFLKNVFFVDIGCHDYKNISNTYFLEKELNWKGLAIDIDNKWEEDWKINRPNSHFICHDATTLNYQEVLDNLNAPSVIDYLSVDTEPPEVSLKSLYKILETNYTFKIITFETDCYTGNNIARDESRKILKEKGYTFVKEVGHPSAHTIGSQDDFWINYNIL